MCIKPRLDYVGDVPLLRLLAGYPGLRSGCHQALTCGMCQACAQASAETSPEGWAYLLLSTGCGTRM